MNKFQLTCLMVMITSLSYSQQSIQRWNFLDKNNNQEKRILIVDSIINNCFWSREMNSIPWNLLRKNNFSEKSKQKLVDFFNRSLDRNEIEQIKTDCKFYLQKNINDYKEEAKHQNLSFEEYYDRLINNKMKGEMINYSKIAKNDISPLYPRLLGWLDYKQAIPLLESILKDSIQDKNYASNNREEFILNCKLALARMGDKIYENELLEYYRKNDLDCSKYFFYKTITDLSYIGTRNSVDELVRLVEKTNGKMYYLENAEGIAPVSCSQQTVVMISLSSVIQNLPMKYNYPQMKEAFSKSLDTIELFSNDDFYLKQNNELLKWLKNNKNSYQINKDQFFY